MFIISQLGKQAKNSRLGSQRVSNLGPFQGGGVLLVGVSAGKGFNSVVVPFLYKWVAMSNHNICTFCVASL